MNDHVLSAIREARALLLDESNQGGSSRPLSMAVTKLDEAEFWRQRDLQLKTPPLNESNGP